MKVKGEHEDLIELERIQRMEELREVHLKDLHKDEYIDYYMGSVVTSPGSKLLNLFVKTFTQISVNNELYGHLVLHLILGQLLKDVYFYVSGNKRDLRIHVMFIQDSGSGKTTALPFLKKICDYVEVPFYLIGGEMTEAAYVGSYSHDRRGRTEKIPGLLERFKEGGIIAWDEARVFVTSHKKEYNKNIVEYTTTAMNPFHDEGNMIRKLLKGGMETGDVIEFNAKESFLFTTYPSKADFYELLNTGFFQRVMPYYSSLSDEEWIKLSDDVYGAIYKIHAEESVDWKKVLSKQTYDISQIGQMLVKVKDMTKNINRIRITREADIEFAKARDEFNKILFSLGGDLKILFNTFRVRAQLQILKISIHRALMDYRTNIIAADVVYAKKLVFNLIESLIEFIESIEREALKKTTDLIRWEKFIRNMSVLKKTFDVTGYGIETKSLIKSLSAYFGVSIPTIKKDLQNWENKGLIKRNRHEGKSFVVI